MTNNPHLGAGNVDIVLKSADGASEEKLVLTPSYLAMRTISTQYGGLMKAMERIANLEAEVIEHVVALGLGYGTQTKRPPKDLPERIWRTGMTDDTGGLPERCILYLRVLMSGGQMPKDDGEVESDTAAGPP